MPPLLVRPRHVTPQNAFLFVVQHRKMARVWNSTRCRDDGGKTMRTDELGYCLIIVNLVWLRDIHSLLDTAAVERFATKSVWSDSPWRDHSPEADGRKMVITIPPEARYVCACAPPG